MPCRARARGELPVLLPSRRVLRDRQIVDLQTPAPDESRVFSGYEDQAITPPVRQYGGSLVDTVGVVTELAFKGRAFTNGPVDKVAAVRIRAGKNDRFVGDEQFGRRIRKLAENRLAADHHDVLDIGDGSRGANDMLEFRAVHKSHSPAA